MKENNSDIIIKCDHLGYTYSSDIPSENTVALRDINLSVRRGEYLAILGHNGSGKSTLAKLMNMILTPTEGRIFLDGRELATPDFSDDDVYDVRRKIGMVFQNPDNQLVATLVDEDVAFGPENLGLARFEIKKRVREALDLVGMTEYAHHAPHKLSGGQKQRVAIAGIIAMKPEIIVFDESTAMLDPGGRAEVMDIMERLNREENITIINITHYMEEAARAERIVVINDGTVFADGTPREVFSDVDGLHSIGLEAPQSVEAVYALRKAGYDIPCGVCLTAGECVAALTSYFGGVRL